MARITLEANCCDFCYRILNINNKAPDTDVELCRSCSKKRKIEDRRLSEPTRPSVELTRSEELSICSITRREKEVLSYLVCGHSNPEIAKALVVTKGTIDSHIYNLLGKLDAKNRLHLAIIALKNKIVSLEKHG